MIAKWKRQLLDELPSIFSNGNSVRKKEREYEKFIASLYQKIGQLEIEIDWLKKIRVSLKRKHYAKVGLGE